MADKKFKTHNQQLKILRERGLVVPTNGTPKRVLEKENYYNVINGYNDLFIAIPKTAINHEQYIAGTQFSEICSLYEFDIELKSILLKRILRVENNIKSAIAYEFSKKYGHDNYMKIANFEIIVGNSDRLQKIINLIKDVQTNIARQVTKHESIRHYMSEYGYIPLWVLMNILTLGTVSLFYSLMKQPDRQSISRPYGISDAEMQKILGILTLCRNKCAHDERLFNFRSPKISIISNYIHNGLAIPVGATGPICGMKDLFAVVISFKLLLNKSDFQKMAYEIRKALRVLERGLSVITKNDVIDKMGFPANWEDIITL